MAMVEVLRVNDWLFWVRMGYWKGEPWTLVVIAGAPGNQRAYAEAIQRLGIWPVIFERRSLNDAA